jgi:hypothetical protein
VWPGRDGRPAVLTIRRNGNRVGRLSRGHALDLHHLFKSALLKPDPRGGEVSTTAVGLNERPLETHSNG